MKRTQEQVDTFVADARPWIYRLALAIVNSPDLAEDVAQIVLLKLNHHRHRLRQVENVRAWVRRVVVRASYDALTRGGDPSPLPVSEASDPTTVVAVELVLGRLSPEDRLMLALAHFEDLSYEEMSDALGIPMGTVASRLNRARAAFRREWEK